MSQRRSSPSRVPAGGRPARIRQASRHEREQRRQRIAIGAVLGGSLLVLAILAIPLLKNSFWDPSRQLAAVGDRTITRAEFDKYQRITNTLGPPSGLSQIFQAYRQNPTQVREALESQAETIADTPTPATAQALDPLVNDTVLVASAGQGGVNLSDEQVEQQLREYAYPQAQDAPEAATTAVPASPTVAAQPAATAPAVTPTPGPPTDEQLNEFFGVLDDTLGISKEDYKRLAVQPEMVREQYIEKNVPKATEQVHVRHILVQDKAAAGKILQDIKQGQKFEVLARERSQDTSNSTRGGDLGWATRESFVPEFSNAAFALKEPGQLSAPVQTQFGWHVIQLLERSKSRSLTEEQQQQVGQSKLQQFIEQQRKRLQDQGQLQVSIPATPTPAPTETAGTGG